MIKAAVKFIICIAILAGVSCRSKPELLGNGGLGLDTVMPYSVVFFVTADCPLCRIYRHKISELQQKLPSEWGVYTVREDSAFDKIKGQYGVEIGDRSGKIAKVFGATVTPQVFVIKGFSEIIYSGAIDNYAFDTGKHRPAATVKYLDSVLIGMTTGNSIVPFKTEPVGCFIE